MLRPLLFALSVGAVLGDGLPGINVLADVVVAAEAPPGITACAAAEEVIDYCVDAVSSFTDNPAATPCICCYSTSNLAPVFGSCASYIKTSASSRTSAYSRRLTPSPPARCRAGPKRAFFVCSPFLSYVVFTGLSQLCLRNGAGLCTSATIGPRPTTLFGVDASATGTGTGSRSTTASGAGALPAGCSSLFSMATSCSRKIPGFTDLPDREAASCYW